MDFWPQHLDPEVTILLHTPPRPGCLGFATQPVSFSLRPTRSVLPDLWHDHTREVLTMLLLEREKSALTGNAGPIQSAHLFPKGQLCLPGLLGELTDGT